MTQHIHHYNPQQRVIICSDIHLRSAASGRYTSEQKLFVHSLKQWRSEADAVYIIGDCFDHWIQPDCRHRYSQLWQALTPYANHSPVYFMPGNRDFLIDEKSLTSLGFHSLCDPWLIQHGQRRILLSHGDQFCTGDTGYQIMRKIIRNPWAQRLYRALSSTQQQWLAQRVIQQSKQAVQKKNHPKVFATCPHKLQTWLHQHQADELIHGHIHQLQQYSLGHKRISITDAWEHQINYIALEMQHSTLYKSPHDTTNPPHTLEDPLVFQEV